MDEVLRGAFEDRIPAMVAAINAGIMMPSEARELENRPFVEGSDQLFINAAVVPIDQMRDLAMAETDEPLPEDTDPVFASPLDPCPFTPFRQGNW